MSPVHIPNLRATLPLLALAGLWLPSCGGSAPTSTNAAPKLAILGKWTYVTANQGSSTIVSTQTFAEESLTLEYICSRSGRSVTTKVESKVKYTANTYEILERKSSSQPLDGFDCTGNLEPKTLSWTVTGDTLIITGSDGIENRFTRIP